MRRAIPAALLAAPPLPALACTTGGSGGEDGDSLVVLRNGEVLARERWVRDVTEIEVLE